MTRITIAILLAAFLAGCAIKPTHDSLRDHALPRLVPVRDFVANTSYNGHYRISPDGTRLAWKAVAGTREEIFVRSLDQENARSLGFDSQGYDFRWAQDSRRLLFIRDAGGNENFHLFRVDVDAPERGPVDITPLDNVRVGIQQIIRDDPQHILITHNARDKAVFDLYRLDIDSGVMERIYRNEGRVTRLVTDREGRLRGRVRQQDGRRYLELPDAGSKAWRELIHWDEDDDVRVLDFTADGQAIHLLSNRGRDKIALVRLDTTTGQETVVYADPRVDLSFVQIDSRTLAPALAYSHPDYPHVEALDPALARSLAVFRDQGPVGIYVTSADDAGRYATVSVNDDRTVSFYLLDRHNGERLLLGRDVSQEFADALGRMRPISFTARDGLQLHGYLTLPPVSARPLPMVLLVHGGPFVRDIWQYNRRAQFLANRGYAVLQVNYRGSSGYGRAFMDAAMGEFAGRMHHDLVDGVKWAVSQGIADPQRVAIMGRSYGGYATLVGMTMTPGVFACGVDTAGPADLESLTRDFPVYWQPFMHRWKKTVGDPADPGDRDRMQARSPINYVDQVQGPLLIIQGANDVRVKLDQSDRMVEALREAGKPVDYLVLTGEGHRIRHWKNRLRVYRETEDFLASCLGGRSSGFDYYQLGSWLF